MKASKNPYPVVPPLFGEYLYIAFASGCSAVALLERGAHLCPAAPAVGLAGASALARDGIGCTDIVSSCWSPGF